MLLQKSVIGLLLIVTWCQTIQGQVHCQAGDQACQRCSATCTAINPSHLPECCEAFNACCDEYFIACKQCDAISAIDKFFPEYCCASFTSCCDKVVTISISAPTTKRPRSNETLSVNSVQAPSPTSPTIGHLQGSTKGAIPIQRAPTSPVLKPTFVDNAFLLPEPVTKKVATQETTGRRRGGNRDSSRPRDGSTRSRGTPRQTPSESRSKTAAVNEPRVSTRGRVSSRGRQN